MMISPKVYVNDYKTMDYHELIKERDRLIRSIRSFEKKECAGDRTGMAHPAFSGGCLSVRSGVSRGAVPVNAR